VQQKIEKNLSECRSKPFRGLRTKHGSRIFQKYYQEKTTFDVHTNHFVKLFGCCSGQLIFFAEFHSIPFQASELALLRNSKCLGMSAFFRGNRSESIPRYFFGTKFRSQPYSLGGGWVKERKKWEWTCFLETAEWQRQASLTLSSSRRVSKSRKFTPQWSDKTGTCFSQNVLSAEDKTSFLFHMNIHYAYLQLAYSY
jgi:hypothetical protein